MRTFDIEIGKELKLDSMVFRVVAKDKLDAIQKAKELGFNCGERLASFYSGDFGIIALNEIKKEGV